MQRMQQPEEKTSLFISDLLIHTHTVDSSLALTLQTQDEETLLNRLVKTACILLLLFAGDLVLADYLTKVCVSQRK